MLPVVAWHGRWVWRRRVFLCFAGRYVAVGVGLEVGVGAGVEAAASGPSLASSSYTVRVLFFSIFYLSMHLVLLVDGENHS